MGKEKPTYQAGWVYQDKQFAEQYDRTRYEQDRGRQVRDRKTQEAILAALARLDGAKKLLDLPCGTGRLAALLLGASYDYTGSDISQEMIDVAVTKVDEHDRSRFVQANAEHLPFADNSFDCVVCVRFLGRIPEGPRLAILKELRRVASKYLLVSTGYFGRPKPRLERFCLNHAKTFAAGAKRAVRHAALRRELDDAGWALDFWLRYKSRGPLSTTKYIGVYRKRTE